LICYNLPGSSWLGATNELQAVWEAKTQVTALVDRLLTLAHLRSVEVEVECAPNKLEGDMPLLRIFLEPFLRLRVGDLVSDTLWVYPPYERWGNDSLQCERVRTSLLFSQLFARGDVESAAV